MALSTSTLKMLPILSQIVEVTPEEVLLKWKPFVQRGVGIKQATQLVEAAKKVLICMQFSKREMDCLIEQYDLYKKQLEQELEYSRNHTRNQRNDGNQSLGDDNSGFPLCRIE